MQKRPTNKSDVLLRLARSGPLRSRELAARGIPRSYLGRLVERGQLERVGRGLYRAPNARVTELHTIAETMKRVPHGVICLLSALQMHGLTTEVPHAVWVLIHTHARAPRSTPSKVEIVRASGLALTHGVAERTVEGVAVRLTSPSKTVADCFRYRRHVGLDVAISALREYLTLARSPQRKRGEVFSIEALVAAGTADRISSVMRPYLEALA